MILEIILGLLLLEVGISIEAAVEMTAASSAGSSAASATRPFCPRTCLCTSSDVIQCQSQNLTQPPIPIEDSKASDLLLSGNRIAQIDLVFLKHYPSLRVLQLSQNGLR